MKRQLIIPLSILIFMFSTNSYAAPMDPCFYDACTIELGGNEYSRAGIAIYSHPYSTSYNAATNEFIDQNLLDNRPSYYAYMEIQAEISNTGELLSGSINATGTIADNNIYNQNLMSGTLVDFEHGMNSDELGWTVEAGFGFIANVSTNPLLQYNSDWAFIRLNKFPDDIPQELLLSNQWFTQSWDDVVSWTGSEAITIWPKVSENADFHLTQTLSDYLQFDFFWDMTTDPPPYEPGNMFDVLALQGGDGWQYIGQIDAYNSSDTWQTALLTVPEEMRGMETEIRFVLADYDPDTNPVVYLKNINAVPEPSTMILFSAGLIGLAGWGSRRKFRK